MIYSKLLKSAQSALSLLLLIFIGAYFGNNFVWLLLPAIFLTQANTLTFTNILKLIFIFLLSIMFSAAVYILAPAWLLPILCLFILLLILKDREVFTRKLSVLPLVMLLAVLSLFSLKLGSTFKVDMNVIREILLSLLIGAGVAFLVRHLSIKHDPVQLYYADMKKITSEMLQNILIVKQQIAEVKQDKDSLKPSFSANWIYDEGLNVFLREGFRFFALQLEQLDDIQIRLHEILQKNVTAWRPWRELLLPLIERQVEFLSALNAFFLNPKTSSVMTMSDENAFLKFRDELFAAMPPIELLDTDETSKICLNIFYMIFDMRRISQNLITALPKGAINELIDNHH